MKHIINVLGVIVFIIAILFTGGLFLFSKINRLNQQKAGFLLSTNKNEIAILANSWPKNIDSILLPNSFERIKSAKGSFAFYLQHLPLKKDKTVYLFNGEKKKNQTAQFAVLDISTGTQDLQQCADAVMRLRAEYFYAKGQTDSIVFKDNNSKIYKLAKGSGRKQFDNYLNTVFGMCGSYSLAMQLKPKPFNNMQIGDVLIHGGFPGHAVIVVDMAENKTTKEKIFMIAQSYMPAQDIHILVNPYHTETAWYNLNTGNKIYTPEYIFYNNELREW